MKLWRGEELSGGSLAHAGLWPWQPGLMDRNSSVSGASLLLARAPVLTWADVGVGPWKGL